MTRLNRTAVACDGCSLPPKEVAVLVLSRTEDEDIIIGDNIRIVVIDVRGKRVRLGVEAPTDVPVDRGSVWEAKTGKRICDEFNCEK